MRSMQELIEAAGGVKAQNTAEIIYGVEQSIKDAFGLAQQVRDKLDRAQQAIKPAMRDLKAHAWAMPLAEAQQKVGKAYADQFAAMRVIDGALKDVSAVINEMNRPGDA
jgi:hypothetical protein